jgi:hypothetical protein
LGASRVEFWRWRLVAELPEDLFDRLVKLRPIPSTKALAQLVLVLKGHSKTADVERCPHCGEVVRIRGG